MVSARIARGEFPDSSSQLILSVARPIPRHHNVVTDRYASAVEVSEARVARTPFNSRVERPIA